MKKLISAIVMALCIAIMASAAMATPVYTGPTDAGFGVGNAPPLPTDTGYYLWSNDAMRKSWSIRWTGNNNSTTEGGAQSVNWFGSVEIAGGLDLASTTKVMFETNTDHLNVYSAGGFGDFITYTAVAGPAWDGFDFTINGEVGNVIGFNLGNSLLNNKALDPLGHTVATDIFIGSQKLNPTVLVSAYAPGSSQRTEDFEIPAPVPEPGTMMLLGAGFLGLAVYGKRRKNA